MEDMDTPTTTADAQPQEPERSGFVEHIRARPLSKQSREDAYWVTVTDAIETAGVDVSSVDRCSLRYIPEEYDDEKGSGLGVVPALVEVDEAAQSGRKGSTWRSVRTEQIPNSTRSRVQIPDTVLETLGYDPTDCEGALVDIYAGDRMVAFGKPNTRTFDIPVIPDEL